MNKCKYMINLTCMERDSLLNLLTCLNEKWTSIKYCFDRINYSNSRDEIINFCNTKIDIFSGLIENINNIEQLNKYVVYTPFFLNETEIKALVHVFIDLLNSKYNEITKKVFSSFIIKLLDYYKDINCCSFD